MDRGNLAWQALKIPKGRSQSDLRRHLPTNRYEFCYPLPYEYCPRLSKLVCSSKVKYGLSLMNMKSIATFLLFLFASLTPVCHATDWYVSQNGSGLTNGADINNCQTIAWASAGEFGPGQPPWGTTIQPGDTVHLVGTITSCLAILGSGSPGHPITVLFEPGAMMSAPTLTNANSWIIEAGSWITIDGGLNGLIQCTSNGTVSSNGGTMLYQKNIAAFSTPNIVNNVTIQNLTISNMYNRQTNSEFPQTSGDGGGIGLSGNNGLISNCFITGVQTAVAFGVGTIPFTNLTITHCAFSNYNWGITASSGGVPSPMLYNMTITHNMFQSGDMFESPETPTLQTVFQNGTNNITATTTSLQIAPPGVQWYFRAATNLVNEFYWNPSQTWTNASTNVITGCYTNIANQAIGLDTNGNMFAGQLPLDLISGQFANMWFYCTAQGGAWVPYVSEEMGFHRNAMHFFLESSDGLGCISNVVIAYNFIKHGVHPLSHTAGSGAMFFDLAPSQVAHLRIFNNISTLAYPLSWNGGGGSINAVGGDILIANNTDVMWYTNGMYGGNGIASQGSNAFVFNNIVIASTGTTLSIAANTAGLSNNLPTLATLFNTVKSDYNIFYGQGGNSFYQMVANNGTGGWWESGGLDTFYQWTNTFSVSNGFYFDPHSVASAPKVDSNFVPLSTDTVAVGNGTNLTAWGITDDFAGNPRPATGNWTIGAYQTTDGTGSNIVGVVSNSNNGGAGYTAVGITNFVAGGAGPDVTNGLLVWYKLTQTSGTTATDFSGKGHMGTLQGSATWTNSSQGNALWTNDLKLRTISFPSNNGSYNSPDGIVSSAINYTGDWTMTFWVYHNSFPGTSYMVSPSGVGVYATPNQWGYTDGMTGTLFGTPALAVKTLYFIAVSKSSGTNYQLYLNGSTNSSGVLANVNIPYLNIGNRGYGFLGMNGSVEDVRIFNRVLSGSEIATLAANGPNDVASIIVTGVHVVYP